MTAVDTNVLVRVVVRDNKSQALRAHAWLRDEARVFVSKTVLLEFEWVLRGCYGYTRAQILAVVRELLDTVNVAVEDEPTVTQALAWYERGMDFADSLHLASAGSDRDFVTFDIALQRMARRVGAGRVAAL